MWRKKILVFVLIPLFFSFNIIPEFQGNNSHICRCRSFPCCCKAKAAAKICKLSIKWQKNNKDYRGIKNSLIINSRCGDYSGKAFLVSYFLLPDKESVAPNNYFCYRNAAKDIRLKEVFIPQPKKPPRPYLSLHFS